MMNGWTRRQLVTTTTQASILAGMTAPALHAQAREFSVSKQGSVSGIRHRLNDWLADNPLFERENAIRAMTDRGIDAVLVSEPQSVYHLTGIRPAAALMMPQPIEMFALLCRDETQPVRLLMHDFMYYYMAADERPGPWLETRIYTGAGFENANAPRPPAMLRVPDERELSAAESNRREQIEAMSDARAISPAAGVAQMLRDAGLANGHVATDTAGVLRHASDGGLETQFHDSRLVLGEIRRIKSPIEIELMRHAASSNAQAAVQAAKSLRAGAHHADLRREYFQRALDFGGQGVFMAIDRATSHRFDRQFEDGQGFLIDGVSQFLGYHGDFGRTIFLGEPSRRMAKSVALIGEAWTAIREKMVVGTSYGELISAGFDAVKSSAQDIRLNFNVHSVGLWHTDDPGGQSEASRMATRLQPGMVLSVDCPLFDEGIAGSAHFEDLTLITVDGPVALNEEFPAALIV